MLHVAGKGLVAKSSGSRPLVFPKSQWLYVAGPGPNLPGHGLYVAGHGLYVAGMVCVLLAQPSGDPGGLREGLRDTQGDSGGIRGDLGDLGTSRGT